MSRSIFHCRVALKVLVALLAVVLVAACAGNPAVLNDIRYDLGPPPATTVAGTLPPLKVLEVSAPPQLDHDGILYRLSSDSQRTARYANSRWTMSPARLLTLRLRTTLGAHVTVLAGADAVRAPMLKVELEQFEQVFDSATESAGVLTARATLIEGGSVIAQRVFVARAPAVSPDAAGGVRALAAASDDFAGQLGAWLGTQRLAGGE
ncbi:ABC-type transport auxiliary lipoprotein family protein [Paraburkholderia dinghuensis]|uniref:ABC transporter n=1 Tax=Paraburkholderia dinghuensis TaxID=2305225 RepID=A0A3N6MLK9_9BURK|nr:ABC-type transport auxiliary lipoprotein family protein [Paraburkholderia dinghuensis]RQH04684.1 ABC transporter [Paraburkholderia dinghuensis]